MPDLSQNPYGAATIPASAPQVAMVSGVYRDGPFLIVRHGAIFPPVCPVENLPLDFSAGDVPKRRQLIWTPPWAYLFFLAGPWGIAAWQSHQKRGSFTYGLSRTSRRRFYRRGFGNAIALVLLCGCPAFWGSVALGQPYANICVGLVSIVAAVAVATVVFARPIRVAGYRKPGWFKLKGCSPAFLDSLERVSFETLI